jgi:hypothetical protein
MVGAGGAHWQRERTFHFEVLLKPTLTYGKGRPKRFPSSNQCVGRGMAGFPPGVGGLGHPWSTSMSPKLFLLLACLSLTFFPDFTILISTSQVADITGVNYHARPQNYIL